MMIDDITSKLREKLPTIKISYSNVPAQQPYFSLKLGKRKYRCYVDGLVRFGDTIICNRYPTEDGIVRAICDHYVQLDTKDMNRRVSNGDLIPYVLKKTSEKIGGKIDRDENAEVRHSNMTVYLSKNTFNEGKMFITVNTQINIHHAPDFSNPNYDPDTTTPNKIASALFKLNEAINEFKGALK